MENTSDKKPIISDTIFTSIFGSLVNIAASVGIFYAIGLVFFIFQLHMTFNTGFSIALYAASLVSQVVILGQGIRVLLVEPLFVFIACILIIISIFTSPESLQKRALEQKENKPPIKIGKFYILNRPYFWLSIAFVVILIILPAIYSAIQGNYRSALSPILRNLFTGIATIFAFVSIVSGHSFFYRLLAPILILYIGLAITAVVGAQLDFPPLPTVQLTINGQIQQGTLVTHQDSYWYIFTNPDGKLKAIPDGVVTDAMFSP